LAFLSAFGFCWFHFRLFGGYGQALDPLPDPAGGVLGVLEALSPAQRRQAIPEGHQPFRRPTVEQLGELLRVGKGIERGCANGGSFFCGAKRGDGVVIVNRKRRHDRSPWRRALRGQHMNHSELLETQGNSEQNRRWRRNGDGVGPGRYLAAFGI
jgi:hypothetical protein